MTFAEVLEGELALLRTRRGGASAGPRPPEAGPTDGSDNDDERMTRARVAALDGHVTGLSFSGGGIRAGTFAVGVLQGLASLGLLNRFDYLSTVSGGGYAGGWLAAWLKREGDLKNVESQLNPDRVRQAEARRPDLRPAGDLKPVVDEEPEPVRHLRAYSSYMTPRPGLLTADTWTIVLIWLRNVSINMLMLGPLAMLLVLGVRAATYLFGLLNPEAISSNTLLLIAAVLLLLWGVVLLLSALQANGSALVKFRQGSASAGDATLDERFLTRIVHRAVAASLLLTVSVRTLLWFLGSGLERGGAGPSADVGIWDLKGGFLQFVEWLRRYPVSKVVVDAIAGDLGLLGLPNLALHALFAALVIAIGAAIIGRRDATRRWRYIWAAALAGATGGVLFVLVEWLIRGWAAEDRPDLMAAFGPPLGLLVLVGALIVEVGLLGRAIREAEREWWARLSARLTIAAILWASSAATVLYVPGLLMALWPAARGALAAGWLGTTALGIISGRYATSRSGGKSIGIATIAAVAPPVFLVGLLGLVALLGSALLNSPELGAARADGLGPFDAYVRGVVGTPLASLLGVAALSIALYQIGKRVIDVNLFSLNAMYANRLIRCYLGASRRMGNWNQRWNSRRDPTQEAGAPTGVQPPARSPNPATGFDPHDDFDLSDLEIGRHWPLNSLAYDGPMLLVNTTLNLVGGQDLAWRDRKGESFTLSPRYCGSKTLGYAELPAVDPDAADADPLTLGRAMSISGAAVDPNMSFYQSWALTAFLTFFNARLGYWVEKPHAGWQARSPKYGELLWTEFLGDTEGQGDYVHISDGGHFENLGVYELIRRRCRYIVAIDSGEDGDPSNDNLSALIRLCRIDFGVRIQIDTSPLRMSGADRLTQSHAVVGNIRYDDVDHGQMPGVLVYIKISLTGDETADIQKYARKVGEFPHEPTDLRQSFTEEQFEAYRGLGEHVAREVFAEPVRWLREPETRAAEERDRPHMEYVPRLFSNLKACWATPPPGGLEGYLRSADAWIALQRDLRGDPALARLSRDLYPELPPPPSPRQGTPPSAPLDLDRAELHAVGQMLQVMENAWWSLGLNVVENLPLERGWMNVFRRWTNTRAFARHWPTHRSEFSSTFVRFVEDQLHLGTDPRWRRLPDAVGAETEAERAAVALLAAEYDREWPDEARAGGSLAEMIAGARTVGRDRPPIWLLTLASTDPELDEGRFAAGIALAAPFPAGRKLRKDPSRCLCKDFEFLAWVRRPHRSIRLGSPFVRGVLQGRAETDNDPLDEGLLQQLAGISPHHRLTLWARYPKSADDDDSERQVWVSFFARFDFRRWSPPSGVAARYDSLLYYDFGQLRTVAPTGGEALE